MDEVFGISPATSIDYTDMHEICGYQQLLCKIFERAGGFDFPYKSNATLIEVRRQGLVWLAKVRTAIAETLESSAADGLSLGALPQVLNSYDFFYRVCKGAAPADYIRSVRLKIVNRWLSGDKSVSHTDVVLCILFEADRDSRTLDERYSRYAFSGLGQWIDELNAFGSFRGVSAHEAYSRLKYILDSDLFAYLGRKDQPKAKARWVEANILTEKQVDALETWDLWSYANYAGTVGYMSSRTAEELEKSYVEMLSKLANRSDLHPFYRRAIALDLSRYATA